MMAAKADDRGGGGRACRFYRRDNEWFCSTGLRSDIVVEVEGILFHLHKFPLISKCGRIAKVASENTNEDTHHILLRCPGGPDGFYIAARFCYAAQVELTPQNIVMVYCTAEFLEMTEEYDEDNLLMRAESFIRRIILRSWKECILALQSTQNHIPEAENLPVVQKCFNALSMMACTDPSLFGCSTMLYGSLQSPGGSILWNGINTGAKIQSIESDWWFEDVSGLNIPMFGKAMEVMNKRGVRQENIVSAIVYYARKYVPGLDWRQSGQGGRSRGLASLSMTPASVDQKAIVENIVELLPEKKGKSYCRFLLGLLRVSIILNANQSCRESLEKKIGMQLNYATLDGLLVPNFSRSDNLYDTDCVERMIKHFLSFQLLNVASFSPTSSDPAVFSSPIHISHTAKLVDNYLAEVAPDLNLKPQNMQSLMEAFPESLRPLDDGMYRALDIYLKEHPWLPENERVQLCSVINWGRLSIDACTHASQNERLPLRVVLQVLFFEQLQLRAAISNCLNISDNDNNLAMTASTANEMAGDIQQREGWVSVVRENRHLRVDMELIQSKVRELEQEFVRIKQTMSKVNDKGHALINTRLSSISRNLGCFPVSQIDDANTDVIESAGPSPRRSSEKPHHVLRITQ
ncbi:BTB/POZ domain-containing protein [Apostasia shenzhenica]|uniref:BTB/POZ domain-containing protein n=1 Tax=Apostasia shenzhenica TaxID=1088818 RepID=A0A2I0AN67_9ASPA|nr:BTB/POZ domain-containing protein [Apostasia shenzhenica]